jgi:hypothetical protein
VGLNLVGYKFGKILSDMVGEENVEKYLMGITLGVILLSFIPSLFHLMGSKKHKDKG